MSAKWKIPAFVALTLLGKAGFITALFVPLQIKYQAQAIRNNDSQLYLSSPETTSDTERNYVFIKGLMGNLSKLCDRYIMNGSPIIREQVVSIIACTTCVLILVHSVNHSLTHSSLFISSIFSTKLPQRHLRKSWSTRVSEW